MSTVYRCVAPACGWKRTGKKSTRTDDVAAALEHGREHPAPAGVGPAAEYVRVRPHYIWVIPLTVVNVIGVILAIVAAAAGDSNALWLFFPQVLAWTIPFGVGIGSCLVALILAVGMVCAFTAADRSHRWYRFWAGVTMSSFIMFVGVAVAVWAFVEMLGRALSGSM